MELTFDTEANDALQINCLLGGWGKVKGTAWYDDIALELLSARELAPAVAIDAGRRRPPMSKYIYGQFIEHLGRCIYGGIWAEMLEDRKFFYPVGDAELALEGVRPAGIRHHEHARALRGRPLARARSSGAGTPAGIEQGDLALVAGKKYVGRVVLAGDASAAPVRVSLSGATRRPRGQTITVDRLGPAFTATPLAFAAPVTDRATPGW